MTKFYWISGRCLIILLCFLSTQVVAQNRAITGKVTSADDGSGLPGASILEKGTTNGTVTDADGNYSISVQENATLVISFIGYASSEVVVGNQSAIDMSLTLDMATLNEVVVVGYGELDRRDVSGSIVAITAKDFNRGIMAAPQDLLVGKLAGVQITSGSGSPTSNSTIRIRGGSSLNGTTNDPLIIIDGFPVDNTSVGGVSNPLAALNPSDIESYTVLKDASATAIYGSRASNGVIIVTTKQGQQGKPQFSYDGSVSVSSPIKYYDVFSADEYRKFVEESIEGEKINGAAASLLGASNTDWQKEIYRNAISSNHNLTMSGSVKKMPYRLSYGYTDQEGILKNTDMQRQSLNINLNPTFFDDHLKVGMSLKGSLTKNNFGNDGAVGSAISFDPTQPVRDGNTDVGGYFAWRDGAGGITGIATQNPVAMIEQTDNRSEAKRLIGNLQLEYKLPFFPDIKLNANGGTDITESDGHNNAPENTAFTSLQGRVNNYGNKHHSEVLDLYANYTKGVGSHKIDFTAGYSWQHFRRQGSDSTRNVAGTEASRIGTVYKNENYLISFFGRLNYTLKDKYILTATLRDDGSSRFSKENRWGLFPSASLAWRINEESFMADSKIVSNLKLRVSYGLTGQQDITTGGVSARYYTSLATYQRGEATAQYELGNDQFYTTVRPNPYDYNLKWETTSTLNAGLDFGFAGERIYGSIEVYKRETTDLISEIPVSLGSNFSNFLTTNVGSLENNGFEFTLNTVPIAKANLKWNVGFNLTYNKNKITKINLTSDSAFAGVNTFLVGAGDHIGNYNINTPSTSFHVFEQVYNENGKPIEGLYVDHTGKGGAVIGSDLNRIRYKQFAPVVFMGINSQVNYKNFDLSFSGRISLGNYTYNGNWANRATYGALYNSIGYTTNVPSSIKESQFLRTQQVTSYYIQDASFFKMDNISAGYNIDKVFTQKLKVRISLTVRNAFIITKYKGLDPEVENGIDNGFYPRPRVFLLGLNLTF